MMNAFYTFFETALDVCAIAWNDRGIVATLLPDETAAALTGVIARRWPDATKAEAPPNVAAAVQAITAHLAGEHVDLAAIALDEEDLPDFARTVYAEARRIPRGETRTYGEIANAVGRPGAARAVGQALGRNPFPIVVPCHRVLARGGASGGFSAPGGVTTKARLLAIEGAEAPWSAPSAQRTFAW